MSDSIGPCLQKRTSTASTLKINLLANIHSYQYQMTWSRMENAGISDSPLCASKIEARNCILRGLASSLNRRRSLEGTYRQVDVRVPALRRVLKTSLDRLV